MRREASWIFGLLLTGISITASAAWTLDTTAVDLELLFGMKARSIGPATMSGRVAAIEAVASDRRIIYVGAATGGLWKSVNGGTTWEAIFDDQPVASIGSIAVYPASPDVVWVGTGEGNPRNSASVGNGVYKSLDGGKTWRHLGLDKSERVHRILLDPTNREVAYVAALGTSWGENQERGVYKTSDGGATWEQVLYVDERTGAADLVMDPGNPRKLLAAMWDHRRWPWFFRSGGPGSGLFLTYDGGKSWQRLAEDRGLPRGEYGRIGLAIAPSDPRRVYALVEADEEIALYRSDDGGESWKRTTAGSRVGNRPFYYADLRVDPQDPNRIYSLWGRLSVSQDGGKSFEIIGGTGGTGGTGGRAVHPDHHALWIDPNDPTFLLNGNDGGVYLSQDQGENWRFTTSLPLGQFYHIRVDDQVPYNVYGGMQDNGSWVGPSSVWEIGGIRNHHWLEIGFGDGFDAAAVRGDARFGFSMSQQGYLVRWDRLTGERKDIRPAPPPAPQGAEVEKLRFNWNAGFALDPHDAGTIYLGSQFVHRSSDLGESWEIVSPDLTTDNPQWQRQDESGGLTLDVTGAENFTTILAIAPSPLEPGLIWVGTDDGRLNLTRNGGETWTEVGQRVPGVPANTWIPHIALSPHDAATAFVVYDDHRRANWTPYVYKTADYGKSWKALATEEIRGYCLVIAQDPVDPELLFLGTEFGLYISLDGGKGWSKWTHGVPTVSVMDLVVHPRQHDLVLGTHGRAAFVLDDIRPLRRLSAEILSQEIHLFAPPPAQQHRIANASSTRFAGHSEFRGDNRPYGALLTFSLNDPDLPAAKTLEAPQGRRRGNDGGEDSPRPQATIEIRNDEGSVVRTMKVPVHRGVNRTAWDLLYDGFEEPPRGDLPSFFEPRGPEALPGTYQVSVRYGEAQAKGQVEVVADPRYDIPRSDRQSKLTAQLESGELQERLTRAIKGILRARQDVETVLAKVREAQPEEDDGEGGAPHGQLTSQGKELLQALKELERQLWTPPGRQDITRDDNPWSQLRQVQRSLSSSWHAPTQAQERNLETVEEAVEKALSSYEGFFARRVAPFRDAVDAAGIGLLGE